MSSINARPAVCAGGLPMNTFSGSYWRRVREHYERHHAEIITAPPGHWGIDFYAWDFEAGIRMTPIEHALWFDIRAEDAVLYPQYPVAGHFVDYGNPVARVAIECDGAQFHADLEADARRQQRIEAAGWTVYRITGKDCIKADDYTVDELGRDRVAYGPARLFVREIATRHALRIARPA